MTPRFTSLKKVLDLFIVNQELSPGEISEKLGMGRTIVHRYLKTLVEQGKIEKKGKPPYTKYFVSGGNIQKKKILKKETIDFDYKTIKQGYEIFFKFSPNGTILRGIPGMQTWCEERKLPFEQTFKQYIKIHKYIESQQDECGMLHAEEAFGKHFEVNYLDSVMYADQYIYSQFGRGKLAEMTFYAKQSQNIALILDSIFEIFPKLECFIAREKFDAIVITPWSIKRENQILGILKKKLTILNIPFIRVVKYSSSGIFIPQKSLKKTTDRIENAKNTIFVDDVDAKIYKKVLLIDDFVGSGATLNETAKKLKDEGVEQVYGFAFVGNTNLSYEVINEI